MNNKTYTDEERELSAKIFNGRLEIRKWRHDDVITSIPLAAIPSLLEILHEVQNDQETEQLQGRELAMLAKWNGQ